MNMKMKRWLPLLLAAVMVFGLLAGCGSKTSDAMTNGMVVEDMEMGGDFLYESSSTADSAGTITSDGTLSDQKLIKTVELRAETEDLDALLAQLAGHITTLGGYTEYQNVYNGSAYAARRYRSAEMTIRVPAEKLSEFLLQVEGASNVISKTESIDDVTLQYVDTQSRMEALRAEQDRLLELMDQAGTMSDLLEIEARLTEVRYELESVTSQLRVLENLVSYATIELYVDEVEVYTEVEEQTVWQRIGAGFTGNLRDIGDGLTDLFVWVVTYSPQLLLIAAVITVIVALCRRSIKKRKNRTPPAQA